jgi:hypothetical protein
LGGIFKSNGRISTRALESPRLRPGSRQRGGSNLNFFMLYNFKLFDVQYLGNNQAIHKTLELLASSERAMPAHFCGNSFCIDWDQINYDDDYEMSSAVYYETDGIDKTSDIVTAKNLSFFYLLAENLMMGSFILTKLNSEDSIDEFKQLIFDSFLETTPKDKEFLNKIIQVGYSYFEHCLNYGRKRGQYSLAQGDISKN